MSEKRIEKLEELLDMLLFSYSCISMYILNEKTDFRILDPLFSEIMETLSKSDNKNISDYYKSLKTVDSLKKRFKEEYLYIKKVISARDN